jgi:hypothetical protein
VLATAVSFVPHSFDVASGDPRLGGAIVDLDPASGRASAIRRLMVAESMLAAQTDDHPQQPSRGPLL